MEGEARFMVNDRSPRVMQVIQLRICRGKGIEGDPCREVVQIYTLDGELIAENDPIQELITC